MESEIPKRNSHMLNVIQQVGVSSAGPVDILDIARVRLLVLWPPCVTSVLLCMFALSARGRDGDRGQAETVVFPVPVL